MRQKEILALRWKDVDFDNFTLEVNQVLTHDGKDFLDGTKTESGQKTIHLSQSTIKVLRMQKNKVNKEKSG
jgi:integrase